MKPRHTLRLPSLIGVRIPLLSMLLAVGCSAPRETLDCREDLPARVSLTRHPDPNDRLGHVGPVYDVRALGRTRLVLPFESTYDLGPYEPLSLSMARFDAELGRFVPLASEVDLADASVSATIQASGVYTLYAGAYGGVSGVSLEKLCHLVGAVSLGASMPAFRSKVCLQILCENWLAEGSIDFESWGSNGGPGPDGSPIGGPYGPGLGGNICDHCLDSFGGAHVPTGCLLEPNPCLPSNNAPLPGASLTQRGAFDPSGTGCLVAEKTTLLRVPALSLAVDPNGGPLVELEAKVYHGSDACGGLIGTFPGFTFDADDVTKLASVPLDEDAFFLLDGSAFASQGFYTVVVEGEQDGAFLGGLAIPGQWIRRTGDITILGIPVEDHLDITTELPGVYADFDHLGRVFPVRDGAIPYITYPASNQAAGVMFEITAPIPEADMKADRWGEMAQVRDDFNAANVFDARYAAGLLSQADRLSLGWGAAGQALGGGRLSWNRVVGRDNDVLLQEVAHNLGQIENGSPNGRANDRWHSQNLTIGTEGYNLLDEERISAGAARSILWPTEFSDRSRGFFELYEWDETCDRMDSAAYLEFQDPSEIDLADAVGHRWPEVASLIGTVELDGSVRMARSYVTHAPMRERVAFASDYAVAFVDADGKPLAKRGIIVNRATTPHPAPGPGADDEEEDQRGMLRSEEKWPEEPRSFHFVSEVPRGTAAIELRRRGQVLTVIRPSANAPTIDGFRARRTTDRKGALELSWDCTDSDGDALQTSVLVSVDGGESFRPVVSGREGSSVVWTPQLVPGGRELLFQLRVTDGYHQSVGVFESGVRLDDQPPLPMIATPTAGADHEVGLPWVLRGRGFDPEDGSLSGESLRWSSDREGALGRGERIEWRPREKGAHRLTLTAVDVGGRDASTMVTVRVD